MSSVLRSSSKILPVLAREMRRLESDIQSMGGINIFEGFPKETSNIVEDISTCVSKPAASSQLLEKYPVDTSRLVRKQSQRTTKHCLQSKYSNQNLFEIGVDECARGPMFGRVYTAAAVLDESFDHTKMCDSKKIHSQAKFLELATYIKQNAVAWSINYKEPWEIDRINIRQAVLISMQESISDVVEQLIPKIIEYNGDIASSFFIMVDGNDFPGHESGIPYVTIEKGDNTYSSIAAASILAKQAHDEYILDLCSKFPELSDRYGLNTNMGYGTKAHIEGIRKYGITQWHRKTFGICKNSPFASDRASDGASDRLT